MDDGSGEAGAATDAEYAPVLVADEGPGLPLRSSAEE